MDADDRKRALLQGRQRSGHHWPRALRGLIGAVGRDRAMAGKRRKDSQDEAEIRALIERWAEAVRKHDRKGILADHDPDIVMFDVPPPLQLRGEDDYNGSWD